MNLLRYVLVAATLAWLGFFLYIAIGVHPRDRPTG